MNKSQVFNSENSIYWANRSISYSQVNQDELKSTQHTVWRSTLDKYIKPLFCNKSCNEIYILDIGTGPGFFAIILAELGYSVTAVDYTDSMIEEAKNNAGDFCKKIRFLNMDAENLSFNDNSFDVLVTRNLTWNLYNPDKAYKEWERVLKPGGLLLNFDANWYNYLYDITAYEGYLNDRKNIKQLGVNDETDGTDIPAMEAIACKVPLSSKNRPLWDVKFLESIGMSVTADNEIWKKVWTNEEKINNASTPMFLIRAVKPK